MSRDVMLLHTWFKTFRSEKNRAKAASSIIVTRYRWFEDLLRRSKWGVVPHAKLLPPTRNWSRTKTKENFNIFLSEHGKPLRTLRVPFYLAFRAITFTSQSSRNLTGHSPGVCSRALISVQPVYLHCSYNAAISSVQTKKKESSKQIIITSKLCDIFYCFFFMFEIAIDNSFLTASR